MAWRLEGTKSLFWTNAGILLINSGKAYEGTCRIPRQNGDGRGRRLGKKNGSHSVCRGLYMECLISEDTWGQ